VGHATFHGSKRVWEDVRAHRSQLRFFLPKRTAEFNPDEQVWNKTKNNQSDLIILNFLRNFMPHHYRVDFMFFISNKIRQCLLCIALTACAFPALAVDIIINAENTYQLKDQKELRSIFSMRRRYWPNGEKIHVFVLPDNHPLHKTFVKQKLQMFPHQLRRTWDRMTYTGTGQPPITIDSVVEMLEKIKHTKYSIGYIGRRVDDEEIHFLNAR